MQECYAFAASSPRVSKGGKKRNLVPEREGYSKNGCSKKDKDSSRSGTLQRVGGEELGEKAESESEGKPREREGRVGAPTMTDCGGLVKA